MRAEASVTWVLIEEENDAKNSELSVSSLVLLEYRTGLGVVCEILLQSKVHEPVTEMARRTLS